jgi:polysaccharide biosynthesis/export protein
MNLKIKIHFLALFLLSLSLTSCFNSSIMLRTPLKYVYDNIPDTSEVEYRIVNNDIIDFRFFTNDGFQLINIRSLAEGNAQGNMMMMRFSMEYLVDHEGMAKLPVIGKTKLAGKTLREAERYLEEVYSEYYNSPFILLGISNKRVIVFPGSPGDAAVVPLVNNNINLIEALALTGGISENGKARNIKIIRGNLNNPQIYKVNLATIKGLNSANITMQGGDIVYVEPRRRIARGVLTEIATLTSLITTSLLIISLIK